MPQEKLQTVLTDDPAAAAEFIRSGGTCAFPTETVYGLGANVFNADAVAKIFKAKQRPADNPLIAHVGSVDQIGSLAFSIPPHAERLIEKFFPGPLTIVLKKSNDVPLIATAGLDTIGVRMPRHRLAHEFLAACGTPVVAPSANLSGRPSPTTWQAVYEDLNGRIDCILQGDATEIGLESTVVDCSGDAPVVLRQGAVTLADIRAIVPNALMGNESGDEKPKSPGLRYRHYSPAASVVIVSSNELPALKRNAGFIGLEPESRTEEFAYSKVCRSIEEYARSVFEFFRECDRRGIETVYCESVPEEGIGAALMDRLRRAAHG